MSKEPDLLAIKIVNARLFVSLLVLIPILIAIALHPWDSSYEPDMLYMVMGLGALGAFVSIQRQLRSMSSDELALFASSWLNALIVPLVGGILAAVLYCMFLSGLLSGDLFPQFCASAEQDYRAAGQAGSTFDSFLRCRGNAPGDYPKLFFWSFVAGFSERFVIDFIGQFSRPR